jgi:hypothetical protein
MNRGILKIMSGGQTGADRAGLDWAIATGIPHRGWCPKGRKAEDGVIPDRYQLTETNSTDYLTRTRWNVRDSDATLVFTLKPTLSGGSLRTAEYALKKGKPLLHLHYGSDMATLLPWISSNLIQTLNIAGSRESSEPGIYDFTLGTLMKFMLLHPSNP